MEETSYKFSNRSNSPFSQNLNDSNSLSSSPSTFQTYQSNLGLNQSPASSTSSILIKKEKLNELDTNDRSSNEAKSTKTTQSSHFLHNILEIKQDTDEKNCAKDSVESNFDLESTKTKIQMNNNENFLPYQNSLNLLKTGNFFKPFSLSYSPHSALFMNNKYSGENDSAGLAVKNHSYIECVVCHDKSSGKHYGQYTCEGCKSFFKRSVRRNLTYQCRSSKNCPIDQYHRNQCQHCRFKKCLKMGMKKEAVQQGRNPNNSVSSSSSTNSTNKNLSLINKKSSSNGSNSNYNNSQMNYNSSNNNFYGSNSNDLQLKNNNFAPKTFPFLPIPNVEQKLGAAPFNFINNQPISNCNINPLISSAFFPYNSYIQSDCKINELLSPSTVTSSDENIYDFASKFLQKLVEQNYSIPFFNCINQNDQIILLKNCWSELFFIILSQSNLNINDFESLNTKENISDEVTDRTDCFQTELKSKVVKTLQTKIGKLRALNLDTDEYSFLKSIVLFNSDLENLTDKESVESFQNSCHLSLKELADSKDREKCLKFGKILLNVSSYSKSITPNEIRRVFFSTVNDINETIEENFKNFKPISSSSSSNSSLLNASLYQRTVNEFLAKSKKDSNTNNNQVQENLIGNSTSLKFNESILKYQNSLLNSYFPNCLNYTNFLFNFRNPFLQPNKTSLLNNQTQ